VAADSEAATRPMEPFLYSGKHRRAGQASLPSPRAIGAPSWVWTRPPASQALLGEMAPLAGSGGQGPHQVPGGQNELRG